MQRVTVTVDEHLAALAQADVKAGRAASMSAWVADAMRRKALARAELVAELEDMAAGEPYTDDTVGWLAETLGRPTSWVADRLAMRAESAG
jgi:Arc/MetJ-type ribon-helix-helix transcriptional regulator